MQIFTLYILIISGLFIILLERKYPYTSGLKFIRKGFFTDAFWYGLVQSYVLGLLIFNFLYWFDEITGFSRLTFISEWPWWIQLSIFLVTHDLYIYWFHRWQHHNKYLWRLHEAHHSSKQIDWIAGMRSHSFEILINQTIEFAPMILLGASPEVILLKGMIDGIWGMWIHANVNIKSGWLQLIINGPEMHQWHHAIEIKEGGLNYATKFACWDWIFNTAFLPKDQKPSGFGIDEPEFPDNYFKQHIYLFRSFKK